MGAKRGRYHCPSSPACGGCAPRSVSASRKKGIENPQEEALGRSRGGLTTKLHLACDGRGRPLSVVTSKLPLSRPPTHLCNTPVTARCQQPEVCPGAARSRRHNPYPQRLLSCAAGYGKSGRRRYGCYSAITNYCKTTVEMPRSDCRGISTFGVFGLLMRN
jgi:hypothetical protein